jgi:large subunit ribosomal protein L18Ae
MHLYQLVGRAAPTAKNPSPKIYRMKIFARNAVVAKSKFWYYMKSLTKAKRTGGEILDVTEIFDKTPAKVKNFAIWLRYRSRCGTHNMYKEYRATSLTGAIGQMYSDMAGRHRAMACNIQIIKTAVIKDEELKRNNTYQFINKNLRFPLVRPRQVIPKKHRHLTIATRASTFRQ